MEYMVRTGDTLQSIAQRLLGDAQLWMDIADSNSLTYPYISDVTSEGVVSPGDYIIISMVDEQGLNQPSTVSDLGTDLFLSTNKLNLSDNSGGDLNIDTEGDYQLVSGIDCLIQDTSHRLMTELGSHPYHDNYGSELSFFVGNVSDDTWNIKASLEVQRTLKCDPRITDVGDVNIFSSGIIKYLDYNVEVDDVSYNAREVLMNEEI